MSANVGRTLATFDDAALEAALRDLSAVVVVPPTPDVAGRVATRLREPVRAGDRRREPRFRLRWALIAALVALLVVAGLAAAIGFGLPGLRITFVSPTATPVLATSTPGAAVTRTPSPSGPTITLSPITGGLATDLNTAQSAVQFRILTPAPEAVGGSTPLVYLDQTVTEGEIVLVYPAAATLAAPSDAPIGPDDRPVALVITESRGSIDAAFLGKVLGPGTAVTAVDVGGKPGVWISGNPHALLVLDAEGRAREETLREVGDVLAWVDGGTLVRIESGITLEGTLEIARSIH